jgi:hypothetical protein
MNMPKDDAIAMSIILSVRKSISVMYHNLGRNEILSIFTFSVQTARLKQAGNIMWQERSLLVALVLRTEVL